MGGWPWLGLVSFLLFWGLVAAAIVVAVRLLGRGRRPHYGPGGQHWQPGPPAPPTGMAAGEHILAERFARGEIDEDEFRQRLATLRGTAPHPQQGTPPAQPPPAGPPPAQDPPATP
jgi:putative membrane protein